MYESSPIFAQAMAYSSISGSMSKLCFLKTPFSSRESNPESQRRLRAARLSPYFAASVPEKREGRALSLVSGIEEVVFWLMTRFYHFLNFLANTYQVNFVFRNVPRTFDLNPAPPTEEQSRTNLCSISVSHGNRTPILAHLDTDASVPKPFFNSNPPGRAEPFEPPGSLEYSLLSNPVPAPSWRPSSGGPNMNVARRCVTPVRRRGYSFHQAPVT